MVMEFVPYKIVKDHGKKKNRQITYIPPSIKKQGSDDQKTFG